MEDEPDDAEAQLAVNVGLTLVVTALIQTHPDHAKFQLALTNLLEQQLAAGTFGLLLSSDGKRMARDWVERLGCIRPQTAAGHQAAAVLERAQRRDD